MLIPRTRPEVDDRPVSLGTKQPDQLQRRPSHTSPKLAHPDVPHRPDALYPCVLQSVHGPTLDVLMSFLDVERKPALAMVKTSLARRASGFSVDSGLRRRAIPYLAGGNCDGKYKTHRDPRRLNPRTVMGWGSWTNAYGQGGDIVAASRLRTAPLRRRCAAAERCTRPSASMLARIRIP